MSSSSSKSNLLLVLLLSLCLFSSSMSMAMARPVVISSKSSLLDRLKPEEGTTTASSCWDSLFELQSCTGEVVLFFLNGETYLGPNCCEAIKTIQNHCWPSMLGSVGIDTEEGDILLGYCDAATNNSGSPPQPQPAAAVLVDSVYVAGKTPQVVTVTP